MSSSRSSSFPNRSSKRTSPAKAHETDHRPHRSRRSSSASSERPIATIETIIEPYADGKKLPPPPPAVEHVGAKSRKSLPLPPSGSDRKRLYPTSAGSISTKSQHSSRTASTVSTSGTLGSCAQSVVSAASAESQVSTSSSKKLVRWRDMPASNVRNESLSTAAEVDFERLSLTDALKSGRNSTSSRRKSPPPNETQSSRKTSVDKSAPVDGSSKKTGSKRQRLKDLKKQMARMEEQIQKAIRVELTYLDNAKEIRGKRDRLKDACDSLQDKMKRHGQLSESSETRLKEEMGKVHAKIQKATRLENTYLKKSKQVHDKRYRWTKLYEHACKERQQLEDHSSSEVLSIASDRSVGSTGSMNLPPLLPSTFSLPKSPSPSSSSSEEVSAANEFER